MANEGGKLFLLILCLHIMFYLMMPYAGRTYTHIKGDLFDELLTENNGRLDINRTTFSNESFSFVADTAESGGTGVSRFIDPIKTIWGGGTAILKTFINVAIVPISLFTAFINEPLYLALFGLPLFFMYMASLVWFIRGGSW